MNYTLRAHNILTGVDTEKRVRKAYSQRDWERLASDLMQMMQDLGDDDFEGYIELINEDTGEVVHKMNASWSAQ